MMFYLGLPAFSAVAALVFCYLISRWIFRRPMGTDRMKAISAYIQEGAESYLKQQYLVVGIFFAALFVVLTVMSVFDLLDSLVPFGFVTGGLFSALCGWIGMYMATHSSSRTAYAARLHLNTGLRVAFSAGSVMGLAVVGLALFYLVVWFFVLQRIYGADQLEHITSVMLSFGMGASSYALFARVGGGIYTKAADMGADLVGKVEAGIPEDDPRNPAVIADQVGDNVGDVAGMGADLYESYLGSIIATMTLGATAKFANHLGAVSLPLLLGGCGALASIIGFFFVRTSRDSQKALLFALRRGVYVTAALIIIAAFFLTREVFPSEWLGLWLTILVGLGAGILLGIFTEYFTSASYRPTRNLARSSQVSTATLMIGGLSLGMISTAAPVILIGAAILGSFYLSGGGSDYTAGLYGIGIASVALLSTLGTTLASDAYGPVADNAGGIAQMAGLEEEVRRRTDQLDSLGNTTAATGKGFAIGSAALTTLVLIVAFHNRVQILRPEFTISFDLLQPRLLVGLLIGGALPFVFCSLIFDAVGRAAESISAEVRRQFKEIKGLLEGEAKADYYRCVRITTKVAQQKMVLPAVMAVLAPILMGLLAGVEAVVGLMVGALVSGFVLAVMMANSGGAWDNAKKFIEDGNLGGKGSLAHKIAVIGDTVGDPFKDSAGPAINILLKLMAMVSIVFTELILSFSLF